MTRIGRYPHDPARSRKISCWGRIGGDAARENDQTPTLQDIFGIDNVTRIIASPLCAVRRTGTLSCREDERFVDQPLTVAKSTLQISESRPNRGMTCGYLIKGASSRDEQSQPGINVMNSAGVPVHDDPAALVVEYCSGQDADDPVDGILADEATLRAAYTAAYGEEIE